MTVQRRGRLAQPVRIWPTVPTTDNRGNIVLAVDMDADPIVTTGSVSPQRSQRAEVPGQQEVRTVRLIVRHDMTDIDIWSRVEWGGEQWDLIAPPAFHHGTRHVRHWTIDLRKRP